MVLSSSQTRGLSLMDLRVPLFQNRVRQFHRSGTLNSSVIWWSSMALPGHTWRSSSDATASASWTAATRASWSSSLIIQTWRSGRSVQKVDSCLPRSVWMIILTQAAQVARQYCWRWLSERTWLWTSARQQVQVSNCWTLARMSRLAVVPLVLILTPHTQDKQGM